LHVLSITPCGSACKQKKQSPALFLPDLYGYPGTQLPFGLNGYAEARSDKSVFTTQGI